MDDWRGYPYCRKPPCMWRLSYTPVDPKQFFRIHCSVCVHVCGYTSFWCWHFLIYLKWEQHEPQGTSFHVIAIWGLCLCNSKNTKGEKNRDKDQSQMKSWWNKNRAPPLGETYEWGDKSSERQNVRNKERIRHHHCKADWWSKTHQLERQVNRETKELLEGETYELETAREPDTTSQTGRQMNCYKGEL